MIKDPATWNELNDNELVQQYEIVRKYFQICKSVNQSIMFSMWKALIELRLMINKRKLKFVDFVE